MKDVLMIFLMNVLKHNIAKKFKRNSCSNILTFLTDFPKEKRLYSSSVCIYEMFVYRYFFEECSEFDIFLLLLLLEKSQFYSGRVVRGTGFMHFFKLHRFYLHTKISHRIRYLFLTEHFKNLNTL